MKSRNKLNLSMEITRKMLLITSGLSYSEKLKIFLESYLYTIEMKAGFKDGMRMLVCSLVENKYLTIE